MSQPPGNELPISPDQEDSEALPLVDLDTLPARPPIWRKRIVQIGFLLAALMVVLVTFRGIVVHHPPPGPPAPLQPTALPQALSLLSNVNYGSLSINGQPQSRPLPLLVKLPNTPPYTLTLEAPPFRPLSCPFPPSVPPTPYGFTPCLAGGEFTLDEQRVTTLQMFFTLADLPPAQQQQLTTLIPQVITAQQTITVPAQSAIVTGLLPDGTSSSERFPEPLEASASLVPSQQNSQEGTSCQSFLCSDAGSFPLNGALSGQFWQVTTPVALRWHFTTAGGQVVSAVTFPSATRLTLYLSYVAPTGWQVALLPSAQLSQDLAQLACSTGANQLVGEAQQHSGELDWGVTTLADQGIAGCELDLQLDAVDQGHFLWRFGVLLAADDLAHRTLPTLPMASPAELAAVEGS